MNHREANAAGHPPACTCVDCTNKGLGVSSKGDIPIIERINRIASSPILHKLTGDGSPLKPKIPKRFTKGIIKLILNLLILLGVTLLTRYGYLLFTTEQDNPLKGAIALLIGLATWIIVIALSKSHKYLFNRAKPSFKLTTLLVVIVLLVFTFAGVEPLASYKEGLIERWEIYIAEQDAIRAEEAKRNAEQEAIRAEEASRLVSEEEARERAEEQRLQREEYLEITDQNSGHRNPSWSELMSFLASDDTDKLPYVYPTFVCADFANLLQKNAKEAGWRCAVVTLDMTGYTDPLNYGIASNAGHACNAFETTDKGLVYIDCTGPSSRTQYPHNCDKTVDVSIGGNFIPVSLFPEPGWMDVWCDMGVVIGVDIRW